MRGDGGPAWADAIVICPWTIYRCCGDKRMLERHYDAMKAFVDNIESALSVADPRRRGRRAVAGVRRLARDRRRARPAIARFGNTPKDLIGTAFFCYSAKLLARIAGVLGNVSDLEHYEASGATGARRVSPPVRHR